MVGDSHTLRPRQRDAEKITINLGFVDLGRIDLVVESGFYSNRTDFIRTAIRNQLERHSEVVQSSVASKQLSIGLRHVTRSDLEALRASQRTVALRVLGLASIAADVTPELARETISSVVILGSFHASAPVKAALQDRIS